MSPARRRLLWWGVGVSLTALAITAIVAVVAGDFGDTFWRTIGTIVILFSAGSAALAGLELIDRGQFRPVAWIVLLTAPAEAVTLLIATWKQSISTTYANGLVMCTLFLLAGLVLTTLRLIVRLDRPAVIVLFVSEVIVTTALVALAVPLIWIADVPDAALRALLVLVVLTLLGYVLTPVVQRLARRH
jgi:hypothetical protein